MEKKVYSKSTILKIALLITFLATLVIATVIINNRNAVNAVGAYDSNGIGWVFNINTTTNEITNLYAPTLTDQQAENLVIPSTLVYNAREFTVRSIGSGSSSYSSSFPKTLKHVTIPDTVREIAPYAFYSQYSMESITIGSGVKTIGTYAFYNCSKLENIALPESVETIGNYAFYYCTELKGIEFPEGLKTIGSYAFTSCSKLTGDIVFPKGLTSVGTTPFSGCTKIKTAKISDAVPASVLVAMAGNAGFESFDIYEDSTVYKIEDGVLYSIDGKRLYLASKQQKYKNFVVPSSVTSIEPNAFGYAGTMTGTLTLPEGLQSIGNSAFANQGELTGELRIPDSVLTIGSNAFIGAKGFDRVTLGSGITRVASGTFSGLTDLFVNNVIGSVQFTNGYCSPEPVVHFLNSVKHVIVNAAPGVKLVNAETGAEVETGDYLDETTFRYRVEVENGHSYDNLKLVWFDDNKYENYKNETVVEGQEYEFPSLLRERTIYVQNLNDSVDLSLRTFITEINRTNLTKSRVPDVVVGESFEYKHTKEPVKVKKGDLVTYKVRVYNEAIQIARATEITVHIPEGMTFDAENMTNKNNGWIQEENEIKTSQLAFDDIHSYFGNGNVSYKEVEICLTVSDDSLESEVYKTVFAEITGATGTDSDSTPGNVNIAQNYRIEEITNSNSSSFIFDQEDDDDFDTIVLNSKIRVDYNLRIEKVDKDTDELLAGAKFELMSAGYNELVINNELKTFEDEEIIANATSDENGVVDFGAITTYGEGENIFWIKEIDAPSGYLTNIGKKMKVKVVKTILDEDLGTYSVKVYCESTDYAVDTSHYEFTPVSTAEQLAKMGSGEIVNVNGVNYEYNVGSNYKLINDIDLSGINWTPIDKGLIGIIDGDGHKISNLTIETGDRSEIAKIGLIGEFTGIIENLTLENPNIHMTTFAEGVEDNTDYYGVGGFVGFMKQGYIYNCKTTVTEGATASITSGVDNVGGFIGHTAPDGLVTIINSENNVDVIGAEGLDEPGVTPVEPVNNAGGLIGCSLGSINIQNSKNTGKINSGLYGAGGLVGFVKPSDYEELSITAGYDEDNKRIDLLVENEAAKGQYNLTLEIRDRKTDRLIGGAIYEVDKVEDNIKTALLETGTLKLFDKEIEYSGKDVYFMTEEETVPGYDLLNGIIRVDINRYWDNDANEYRVRAEATIVTQKDYLDFVESRETKEDEARTGNIFDRGVVFTDVNIEKANWNGSKIEILNCVNDGEISATKSNAAGMIGTSYGVVKIDNCTNNGEIKSNKKAGGMTGEIRAIDTWRYNGEIESQNSLDYNTFNNCTNNGKISTMDAISSEGAIGGIAAEIAGSTKVMNCANNGEIRALRQQAGGIVGHTFGAIIVEDSINNGKIVQNPEGGNYVDAAGIIGSVWFDENQIEKNVYDQITSVVKNCKNYGELESNGTHGLAGIIGLAAGKSLTITDCEVAGKSPENKLKIHSSGKANLAGIIAFTSCKYVTIKDCKVKNVETKHLNSFTNVSTDCNVGGILANNDRGYIPNKNYNEADRVSTHISNCIVENCSITGFGKEVAGIMGITNGAYGSIKNDYVAYIQDCNVKDSFVGVYSENAGGSGGGIVSAGIYAGGYECKGFDIKYCNVENTRLEAKGLTDNQYAAPTTTVGGIFGRGEYTRTACNIEGCTLKNSTLYNKAKAGTAGNTGGIFGISYAGYDDLTIKGCNVSNCEITDYNTNPGGIMGGFMQAYNDSTLTIENCNVIETNISRLEEESQNVAPTNDCCAGGLAGSIQDVPNLIIKNIKIIGKDIDKNAENANERNYIHSKFGNVGGLVGMMRNNTTYMSDIEVKNYDVINDVDIYRDKEMQSEIAGTIATINNYQKFPEEYTNITIDNVKVKANHAINAAGFVAYLQDSTTATLKNINIKNTDISNKYDVQGDEKYGNVGGLISTNNAETELINCKVEDMAITTRGHIAAGGIAISNGMDNTVINCEIKNVAISDEWQEPESLEEVADAMHNERVFAGFIGVQNTTPSIKFDSIKISNVDIDAKYASIGGIYGSAKRVRQLKDCVVENCKFTSKKSISGVKGSCAGIGAVTESMNCVPTNNKVSNIEITTDYHINAGMFGYIKDSSADTITINDSTVENVTLTHENEDLEYNVDHDENNPNILINYNPLVAGVVAITENDVTINNATVKNSTMNVKNGGSSGYTHVGGIIALSGSNINIDNSKVINTSIINNTNFSITGGLVGLNTKLMTQPEQERTTTITNSSIEQNSSIDANNQIGGLVGFAKVQLNNDKVLNLIVRPIQTGYVGGAVALTTTGASTISNVTIKDLTVPDGEIVPTNVGGIAAQFSGTLKNSTVTDSTLVANQCAAGVVAISQNPTSGQPSEISDVTVTNVTVTSKGNIAAGVAAVTSGTITNAKVYNSEIETKGTNMAGGIVGTSNNTISDVIVEGTDITSNVASSSSSAGGIGACLYGAVSNAKVKDSNIKAQWHAGGIAATTMSSITEAEIDNVDISTVIQSAGGVVSCTNGTVTNASVKDSTVKGNLMAGGVAGFGISSISGVEVNNTSVYAVEDAGGVVGVTSGSINGAEVTESTIVCKKLAGGIAGTMETEIKNATVDGSTITSEEMHVGGIVACTRATIDNCTTKNSTIKTLKGSFGTSNPNPTCLGGLVGAGSGDSPSIINSTVENNTLTGATGTLIGKYIGAPTEINEQLVAGE